MEVTRDVIVDLLPVYLMGEASPATRALVEDWLGRDPELAERVRTHAADVVPPGVGATPPPPADIEMRSVARTREVLTRMRWLFALGCTFASLGLGVEITTTNGRFVRLGLLLLDHPLIMGPCFALGLACFVAYFALRRGLGSSRR